jgi:hypothetical protein
MTAPSAPWALTPILRLTALAMIFTIAATLTEGWVRAILVMCGVGLAAAAAIKLVRHMKRKP